ncbi:unnamed protein product [Rhodiola kirilowii]
MGGSRCGLSVAVLVLILIVAEALDGDGNVNDGVKASKEQGAEYKHVWPEMKFGWRIVVLADWIYRSSFWQCWRGWRWRMFHSYA